MLTGDENLVNVAATVHYRVRSAAEYVLNVGQPRELLRDAAEASLRQTIGLRTIDDLLAREKGDIQEETRRQLQTRLDASRAGLEVVAVQLTEASPPEEVASAFLDVASAREDRATYINEGEAYRNEIVPRARGMAARQLREAEAYKAERTAAATGEAQRFTRRLAAYKGAPAITRTRLYLEAIERVLPNMQKFILTPGVGTGALDLWFNRGGSPPMLPEPPRSQPSPMPFGR